MKTNTLKYVKLALVAVLMVNLTSCEIGIDRFHDNDNMGVNYNRTNDLTSRTWVSFYQDVDGNNCCQELDFYSDRTGVDFIQVEYPNGRVKTFEYRFYWKWENYAQTSIRMDYGSGDYSFLDDVYIGGNRLSGYLDGQNNYVEFKGKR